MYVLASYVKVKVVPVRVRDGLAKAKRKEIARRAGKLKYKHNRVRSVLVAFV